MLTVRQQGCGTAFGTTQYANTFRQDFRGGVGGTFQTRPASQALFHQAALTTTRTWRMANVVSADHKRFLSNLYLNRELDRLTSFSRWSMARLNVSPAALAKSGFFYLGDMDRTQCFSCGGVLTNWTLEDDVEEEHRMHFSSCRFAQGLERRNIPIPRHPETQEQLEINYPCQYAANPHMRSESARRATFEHGWVSARIGASPAAIAEAGFFFLGERDRVKCWYCNGGLQNWEYDDIPWVEHAKWFPNCQFLLRSQGATFVHRFLAQDPQLPRPIIAKQEGSPMDVVTTGEEVRPHDIQPGTAESRRPDVLPIIIDPQAEMRKIQRKVNQMVATSDVVKTVLEMGFSERTVRLSLVEKIEMDENFRCQSTQELLEAVMARDAEIENENRMEVNASNAASGHSSLGQRSSRWSTVVAVSDEDSDYGEDIYSNIFEIPAPLAGKSPGLASHETRANAHLGDKHLKEKLKRLKEEMLCKICFANTADMAFVPCSHMCCCIDCTQALRQCPICRTRIEKAIKTYTK